MSSANREQQQQQQHLPVPAFLRLQQLRAAGLPVSDTAASSTAGASKPPLAERCRNVPEPQSRPQDAAAALKTAFAAKTSAGQPSASSMQRRNQRERNRVKLLNLGFERLRQLVPSEDGQRLSKISTLRAAIAYIRSLQELLDDDGEGCVRDAVNFGDIGICGGGGGVSDSWLPPKASTPSLGAVQPAQKQRRLCDN